MDGDYGYFGTGSTGYAHYTQAFERNFGGGGGGGGGGGCGCSTWIIIVLVLGVFYLAVKG